MRQLLSIVLIILISGCTTFGGYLPSTPGEKASGYSYIPLDGLAVDQKSYADSCKRLMEKRNEQQSYNLMEYDFLPIKDSFPDISVRFAVGSFDTNGGLVYGPAKVTEKYKEYRAILDYVNVDEMPVTFWITTFSEGRSLSPGMVGIYRKINRYEEGRILTYKVKLAVEYDDEGNPSDIPQPDPNSEEVTFPVYVGIGMRLSADIQAIEGGATLTSLGAIGLEAQAKHLTGTLTVQTIGISGENIGSSLPLPSNLDQSTIENAILAIGSIRAVMYSANNQSNQLFTPRVVGLYSPIGSAPALINAIYSELSKTRPGWPRPCKSH